MLRRYIVEPVHKGQSGDQESVVSADRLSSYRGAGVYLTLYVLEWSILSQVVCNTVGPLYYNLKIAETSIIRTPFCVPV